MSQPGNREAAAVTQSDISSLSKDVREVRDAMIRLETMVGGRGGVLERVEKIEGDVENAKSFRNQIVGWAAGVAAVAGLAAGFVKDFFTGK